jgi:N-acetyl-anhydromuramyl-L-alanine amidase AmpD
MRLPVRRPHERVKMRVRNQSARNTSPLVIVLHDTESHDRPGNSDLLAIGAWFDNPAAQASAHVCVDGTGRSAQYVPDHRKAWHCAAYNSASLGIEQIGFATFHTDDWTRSQRAQLKKVAKYIAYWSKKYNIPIQHGRCGGGDVLRRGVVTHADLGTPGGGHHDPGPYYPLEAVLHMARYYARRGWI